MTSDQIHSALVRWLTGILGVTVIKAYQSGQAPALPYVMVNLTGFAEVREHPQTIEYANRPDLQQTGDEFEPVEATPIIEGEWRFSVHAYGENATEILLPVVSATALSQLQEPLLPSIVVFDISQIRHLPEWINEQWQPRSQMDINLRALLKREHLDDVIEEATWAIGSV